MSDYHPELAAHDDDEQPLRSSRRHRVLRVVVVLGILALVLPSILVSISVASTTAANTCTVLVERTVQDASPSARFEVFGPAGPAWYCYADRFSGGEFIVASLGLIPGPPGPPANS
ncbi:hypothetical protein GCM10027416_07750 [Okibacterium endophyticum]